MNRLPLALLFTLLATGCASYRQQVRDARRQQPGQAADLSAPPRNDPYAMGREAVEWLRQEGYIMPGGPCATLARFPENRRARLRVCINGGRYKKNVHGKIVIDFP